MDLNESRDAHANEWHSRLSAIIVVSRLPNGVGGAKDHLFLRSCIPHIQQFVYGASLPTLPIIFLASPLA